MLQGLVLPEISVKKTNNASFTYIG